MFETLFRYYDWANARVLAFADALPDADYHRDLGYSWRSVHGQLVHMMAAETVWFSRLGGTSPDRLPGVEDVPSREALREAWAPLREQSRAALSALDLEGTFTYTTTSGKTHTNPIKPVLLHVLNHATDHRAQVLQMIHKAGGETGEQDLLLYLREHPEERIRVSREDLRLLLRYTEWANGRVWAHITALSGAQFVQDTGYSYPTVRDQIVHMMDMDNQWLHWLRGEDYAPLLPAAYATRPLIEGRLALVRAEQWAALQEVKVSALHTPRDYHAPWGKATPGEVLLHLANHATDHRAQILQMMHDLGGETSEQDLIIMLRSEAVG